MQKITYLQAASILGVKQDTIKNSVFYGRLTRCVLPVKEAMLLKEQVELFKNKRITKKSLNLEEKALWEEYEKIARNSELLELATKNVQANEPASVLIAKEIARAGYEIKMQKVDTLLQEIRSRLDTIQEIQRREIEINHPQMPLALK